MKKLITIISLFVALSAHASDHSIIVHSQGITIKITEADISYILSKTANESIKKSLLSYPQTIRNNDVADNIIAIMMAKK